jgi:hypothetical protein
MAFGSTQLLIEISTRNLPGVKGRRLARKAENLTAIFGTIIYKNVGTSTSHNRMDLHGLISGQLCLTAKKKREFILL